VSFKNGLQFTTLDSITNKNWQKRHISMKLCTLILMHICCGLHFFRSVSDFRVQTFWEPAKFFAVAAKILIVVRMLPNRQIVQFAIFSRKLGLLYTDEISYATPDKRGFCGENGVKVVVFGNVIYHCGLIFWIIWNKQHDSHVYFEIMQICTCILYVYTYIFTRVCIYTHI